MSRFSRIAIWQKSQGVSVDPDKSAPRYPASTDPDHPSDPATQDAYASARDASLTNLFGAQNLKRA